MANPTAESLLVRALDNGGYHGLYTGDCCCEIDDLVVCGLDPSFCLAGYRQPVAGTDEFVIGQDRPPPAVDDRQLILPIGQSDEESE
jgi:hypothetical protein